MIRRAKQLRPGDTMAALFATAADVWPDMGRDERHDMLRDFCGVRSLRALPEQERRACLKRLREFQPRPHKWGSRTPRGVIRGMSAGQRKYTTDMAGKLGWSPAMLDGWLKKRHKFNSLDDPRILAPEASKVITELQQAVARMDKDVQSSPCGTEAVHGSSPQVR